MKTPQRTTPLFAALLLACAPNPESDTRPPAICASGADNALSFVEVTDELGLSASGLDVEGNLVMSADIDGDHWPDLLVSKNVRGQRDDAANGAGQVRLLRNLAGQGFEDITLNSGLTATRDGQGGRAMQFALFADFDNDGDADVFCATFESPDADDTGDHSEILRNLGDGRFELGPAALWYGASGDNPLVSATVLDADLDGQLDLFLGRHYARYGQLSSARPDALYRNIGALAFADDSANFGLDTLAVSATSLASGRNHRPTWGVSACDLNDDGRLDLLVSSYGRQLNPLWLTGDNGRFTERGESAGFWSDGRDDYSGNDYYRCHCHNYGNTCDPMPARPRIQCPASDPWQAGFDDQAYRLGGNSALSACGDVDNDGDLDVLQVELRHWVFADDSDPTELLINNGVGDGGAFVRPGNEVTGLARSHSSVDWNEGDLGGALVDLNNDGRLDVLIASSDYPDTRALLFVQQADGLFVDRSRSAGLEQPRAHGLSLIDYDRDGDYDVVLGTSSARWSASDNPPRPQRFGVRLYRNESGQTRNRLILDLRGGDGVNSDAIGARVTVRAGQDLYVREQQGGHGLSGQQHDALMIIGVGEHCEVDQIKVRWPDAGHSVDRFTDVRANYVLIVRPGQALRYQTLEEYAPR